MKTRFILLVLLTWLITPSLYSQVYHVDISGMIDGGLPHYMSRVIEDARENNAAALLLEIDTFGGRVDAATEIKDLVLDAGIPTYAYVNKRAISAGALISLSCENIGMSPGSSIGAATMVDGGGNKASEKGLSYFRAEMGSTAERHGRNREIAEAMVDETLVVEGLVDSTKLVTLTALDAIKWEMAEVLAPTMKAYMDSVGLGDQQIVYTEINWSESFVRILTFPMVSLFLLTGGLWALFMEIKSPGWGLPGTLGLVCLALFFGSHYIIRLANEIEIILFFAGIILLIVEIFVLPGFGVAGVAGIICIVGGAFLSMLGAFDFVTYEDIRSAAFRVGGALLLTIILSILFFRFGSKSNMLSRIALAPEQKVEEGYVANTDFSSYVGRSGTAVTPLRPTGVGIFDDERLDIVSEGGFIDQDTPIEIVYTEGYRLVVRPAKKKGRKKA